MPLDILRCFNLAHVASTKRQLRRQQGRRQSNFVLLFSALIQSLDLSIFKIDIGIINKQQIELFSALKEGIKISL